jgi:hypothetical protein
LQAEKLDGQKTKVKSRPDYVPFSTPSLVFSKLTGKKKGTEAEQEEKGAKRSWFSKLGKKTKGYMHQLLKTSEDETKGIAPMKWDNFLKVRTWFAGKIETVV